MHILLIEPDGLLGQQYCAALQPMSVTHSSDAQAAIQAIDDKRPDVIVLELLLGGHNGIEFLYELRSYSDTQHLPVILHTYVNHKQFTSDEQLLHELGVVDYLYKPETNLAQLQRAVMRIGAAK